MHKFPSRTEVKQLIIMTIPEICSNITTSITSMNIQITARFYAYDFSFCLSQGHSSRVCKRNFKCKEKGCGMFHHQLQHEAHASGIPFHGSRKAGRNGDLDTNILLQLQKVKVGKHGGSGLANWMCYGMVVARYIYNIPTSLTAEANWWEGSHWNCESWRRGWRVRLVPLQCHVIRYGRITHQRYLFCFNSFIETKFKRRECERDSKTHARHSPVLFDNSTRVNICQMPNRLE